MGSVSAKRMERVLGLGATARKLASSIRGSKSRGGSEVLQQKEEGSYITGDVYKCVCGWAPRKEEAAAAHRDALYVLAVQHWRKCQGARPPRQGKKKEVWARLHAAGTEWRQRVGSSKIIRTITKHKGGEPS